MSSVESQLRFVPVKVGLVSSCSLRNCISRAALRTSGWLLRADCDVQHTLRQLHQNVSQYTAVIKSGIGVWHAWVFSIEMKTCPHRRSP